MHISINYVFRYICFTRLYVLLYNGFIPKEYKGYLHIETDNLDAFFLDCHEIKEATGGTS